MNKTYLFVGVVILTAVLAAFVWRSTRPTTIAFPSVPSPNAYDALLQAAEQVDQRTVSLDDLTPDELAAVVQRNAPVVTAARDALARPSAVPVDWDGAHSPQSLQRELTRAQSLRRLYRALLAAHRHAVENDDESAAIETSLDLARLAAAASRGGLLIDHQIGWAYRSAAANNMYELADKLDQQQCRDVAKAWNRIEWPQESVDELFARDQFFVQASRGFVERLALSLQSQTVANLTAPARKSARDGQRRVAAEGALLLTRLAIREFELAEGHLPRSLEALTPAYLSHVPRDPFTEDPLKYTRQVDDFLLYSAGSNGVDDGGMPGKQPGQDDLMLAEKQYAAGPKSPDHSDSEAVQRSASDSTARDSTAAADDEGR